MSKDIRKNTEEHIPTPESHAEVILMAGKGNTIATIAGILNICVNTFRKYYIDSYHRGVAICESFREDLVNELFTDGNVDIIRDHFKARKRREDMLIKYRLEQGYYDDHAQQVVSVDDVPTSLEDFMDIDEESGEDE